MNEKPLYIWLWTFEGAVVMVYAETWDEAREYATDAVKGNPALKPRERMALLDYIRGESVKPHTMIAQQGMSRVFYAD